MTIVPPRAYPYGGADTGAGVPVGERLRVLLVEDGQGWCIGGAGVVRVVPVVRLTSGS